MRKSLGILAVALLALGLAAGLPSAAGAQPAPPAGASAGGPAPDRSAPPPEKSEPAQKRSGNGAKIGAGIAAGVVGAIILNEAMKAQDGTQRQSCQSLSRMCDEGDRPACRQYDEQCK